MKPNPTTNPEQWFGTSAWTLFAIGFLLTASVVLLFEYSEFLKSAQFWRFSWLLVCIWAVITCLHYRSTGVAFDFLVMMTLVWWLFEGVGYRNIAFLYLPFITAMWITITQAMRSRRAFFLAVAVSVGWFFFFNRTPLADFRISHWLYLVSSFSMLLVHGMIRLPWRIRSVYNIDLIVGSYSGNTAHFTEFFVKGAEQLGAEVNHHRFHRYRAFDSEIRGDALVVAFPVFGGKPPWPFLSYLLFRLPRGRSRPAFILYTCIGGAENAGILCWLILTLKGYRVVGRNWGVYPLNVPTFRLGPRRLWMWLDSLTPLKRDAAGQVECGRRFAMGLPAGPPFVFAWTPFFLVGLLLDNKWLDRIFYRNHVMKKRCNQCEICIDFCPAQRLRIVDGYPKPEGECMICMGCVNVCPKNAMHLWCFTEYGNRYLSKYKKHMMKGYQ